MAVHVPSDFESPAATTLLQKTLVLYDFLVLTTMQPSVNIHLDST
jgi:hypothetical protein